MAIGKPTLARIKDMVEAERAEPPEASVNELKEMIERLKKREPVPLPEAQKQSLNFKKVELPTKGLLSNVGTVYNRFASFFTSLAKIFARFPIGQSIQPSLEAAGMKISPEAFLIISATSSFVAGFLIFLLFVFLGGWFSIPTLVVLAPLLGLSAFIMVAFLILTYPNTLAQHRAAEVDRNLPFALRQMSTQVKAGVSFHKSLQSISTSNYGILSEEFARVVNELNTGETMEAALLKLSRRTFSKGLKRAVTQVIRSFKSGGNLSQIISDIAEDVSFESRMNIRDFTEKLNFINVIYIMVAVVAPVTLAILSAILQIPLFAGGIPTIFIYLGFAGVVVVMGIILYVTKRMEPAVW